MSNKTETVSNNTELPFDSQNPKSILSFLCKMQPCMESLTKTYPKLVHLKLSESEIASVLSGGKAYVSGEISVFDDPKVHTVCSYERVSIQKDPDTHLMDVFLADKPMDKYIKDAAKDRANRKAYIEGHTKEEMYDEIKRLRRQIDTLGKQLNMSENSLKFSREQLDRTLCLLEKQQGI